MIKVEHIDAMNFTGALRGMRNPMDSHASSDSCCFDGDFTIGPQDLKLAQTLVKAGSDHAKFMRQIFVCMDITAPLYWWKEMDTYKVGTVANSESTMHKLASTTITRNCFSFDEDLTDFDPMNLEQYIDEEGSYLTFDETHIRNCETIRKRYFETKDQRYWRKLIQLLSTSWNQKRTWSANYAVLRNIYFARKNHKLSEWREFCRIIETMYLGKELICYEG